MEKLTKAQLKEEVQKERNAIRTAACKLGNLYTEFKKKCIDLHLDYQMGLREALKLWLNQNTKK